MRSVEEASVSERRRRASCGSSTSMHRGSSRALEIRASIRFNESRLLEYKSMHFDPESASSRSLVDGAHSELARSFSPPSLSFLGSYTSWHPRRPHPSHLKRRLAPAAVSARADTPAKMPRASFSGIADASFPAAPLAPLPGPSTSTPAASPSKKRRAFSKRRQRKSESRAAPEPLEQVSHATSRSSNGDHDSRSKRSHRERSRSRARAPSHSRSHARSSSRRRRHSSPSSSSDSGSDSEEGSSEETESESSEDRGRSSKRRRYASSRARSRSVAPLLDYPLATFILPDQRNFQRILDSE
jgi:hypothetical protein